MWKKKLQMEKKKKNKGKKLRQYESFIQSLSLHLYLTNKWILCPNVQHLLTLVKCDIFFAKLYSILLNLLL